MQVKKMIKTMADKIMAYILKKNAKKNSPAKRGLFMFFTAYIS